MNYIDHVKQQSLNFVIVILVYYMSYRCSYYLGYVAKLDLNQNVQEQIIAGIVGFVFIGAYFHMKMLHK